MRDIDVQNEVLVTVGGSEAIYCAVLGLVKPGDEVCGYPFPVCEYLMLSSGSHDSC